MSAIIHQLQKDFVAKRWGRYVTISSASTTICATCKGYDEELNSGYDPYCTACNGTGLAKTISTQNIYCRISWQPLRLYADQGSFTEIGDMYFFISADYETDLKDNDTITVDNKNVVIERLDYIQDFDGVIRNLRVTCSLKDAP